MRMKAIAIEKCSSPTERQLHRALSFNKRNVICLIIDQDIHHLNIAHYKDQMGKIAIVIKNI